ncbi:unnamed protein product [Clonostachys rosea f. rosea IK726]|uniref:Uncharacterized protein n=1 Tax=Clonostachys rosea f. rosea IK726 TaxID=1349383 RepID=A0ACA9U254_BIOOC|nr:unnamed protein product [Clonostachys rosea f. rosea IK726]
MHIDASRRRQEEVREPLPATNLGAEVGSQLYPSARANELVGPKPLDAPVFRCGIHHLSLGHLRRFPMNRSATSSGASSIMLATPGYRKIRVRFGKSHLARYYLSGLYRNPAIDGRAFDIEIQDTATIRALKQSIETETSIPVQRQVLAVLGPGAVAFRDDMLVKDVVKPQSTIMLQDSNLGNNQGFHLGHQYGGTFSLGTFVHQGDTVDQGFWGQSPSNRGLHDFSDVFSTNGILQRGDHYLVQAPGPGLLQQPDHQGERHPESAARGSQSASRRGHTYGTARTEDTDHTQGDEINSGWNGPAPGSASHRYGDTRLNGGGLHQGNKYGKPV